MPNYRSLAQKLQQALCISGQNVTMEEKRFYSIRYGKMMTKYIVKRQQPGLGKETLVETYSIVEVVKKLASIYSGTEVE